MATSPIRSYLIGQPSHNSTNSWPTSVPMGLKGLVLVRIRIIRYLIKRTIVVEDTGAYTVLEMESDHSDVFWRGELHYSRLRL